MASGADLSAELTALGPRPAGSDAERRAARWAATTLRADPRRDAELETVWLRPAAIVAQLWHVAVAVAGGLVAVNSPRIGAGIVFAAWLAIVADGWFGRSPGRLLSRERASQNVVSSAPRPRRVRLVLTARLDTSRSAPGGRGAAPGWVFWLAAGALALLGCAVARYEGARGTPVAALQLAATAGVILVGAFLLLNERGTSEDADGVAAVLALTRLLDVAPPANLGVEVLLAGAGALEGAGLARCLRRHRGEWNRTNTVVLGFTGADRAGRTGYLISDGPFIPVRGFPALAELAGADPALTPLRYRGASPTLAARRRGLPALTLCGDPDGLVTAALDLVDRLDVYVATVQSGSPSRSDRGDRVVLGGPVARLLGRQRKA